MDLNLVAAGKSAAGSVAVSDDVFAKDFNEALIHQVVTAYLAGARQGTRAHKNRSDVSGGGKKPWRQKGTGRARAGTIRSPLWRSGGKTFAIKGTQDHSQKVNKKMYRGAMCSILSELIRQERLVVVEELALSQRKTKDMVALLGNLGIEERVLIIDGSMNENLYYSARNIPNVYVIDSHEMNPVDLIRFDKVVMTKAALQQVEEKLA